MLAIQYFKSIMRSYQRNPLFFTTFNVESNIGVTKCILYKNKFKQYIHTGVQEIKSKFLCHYHLILFHHGHYFKQVWYIYL